MDRPPFRLLTLCTFLILILVPTAAQTPAMAQDSVVVAILDVDRVLQDSKAAAALRQEIDKQRQAHQATLRERENALRSADEELTNQKAVLSTEAFTAKRQELVKQAADLQKEAVSIRKKLRERLGLGLKEVSKALGKVVDEIAEERGIGLILDKKSIVLVRSSEFVITDEVLQRLDEMLPIVDLTASGG